MGAKATPSKPTLIGLPIEILESVILLLTPEKHERYLQNIVTLTQWQLDFFRDWRQRCSNLRLVCTRFASIPALAQALFDTFYWHSTHASLRRLESISQTAHIAALVRNIVFLPPAFGSFEGQIPPQQKLRTMTGLDENYTKRDFLFRYDSTAFSLLSFQFTHYVIISGTSQIFYHACGFKSLA